MQRVLDTKDMKSHASSAPCFYIRQASKTGLYDWCSKTTQEHLPTARNPWDSRTCLSHKEVQVSAIEFVFVSSKLCLQNNFKVLNNSVYFPLLKWLVARNKLVF